LNYTMQIIRKTY